MGIPRPSAFIVAVLALAASPAAAAGPNVVASIGPVHSLVASVMQGVGTPELLLPPGASPHTFALRPSDAQTLRRAKVVFWVGEDLETFLERPLHALSAEARVVALMKAPGVTLLEAREGGDWERHAHEHGDEHAHEHEHEHEEGHHGDDVDPHVWLDPANARAWTDEIARHLADVDPANAAAYGRNAESLKGRLEALGSELSALTAPVRSRPFVVFHDAYHYLENRFGLNAVGSITVSPERAPGVKRVAALRDKVRTLGAVCVFAEPQFEPKLVRTLVEGTPARVGTLDPIGASLPPGPDLYIRLVRGLGTAIASCLAD